MLTDFYVLLFDNFETLDAFGPVEIIGALPDIYRLHYVSLTGGIINGSQGLRIETAPFSQVNEGGILLIPGGQGTRTLVQQADFINQLSLIASKSTWILTVCTGSALLAGTDLLNGHKATSNKRALDWVVSLNPKVHWIKHARWVVDDHIYSSSGVSAGMDMVLGFVSNLYGSETADEICRRIEYIRNPDSTHDPFAP